MDTPQWLYEQWRGQAYVDGELPSAGALPDWEGLPGPVQIEWIQVHMATEKAIRATKALIRGQAQ